MPENKRRFLFLYDRFLKDEASPEEVNEFWTLAGMLQVDDEVEVMEALYASYDVPVPPQIKEKDWSAAEGRLFGRNERRASFFEKYKWPAAASAVFLLAFALFFFRFYKEAPPSQLISQPAVPLSADVKAPAISRATITLANGENILIDSMQSGTLAMQNNIAFTKTADGSIRYTSGMPDTGGEVAFNTLTNPRGSRVINMVLNDGSRVWLNAASSITYPVAFRGNKREVSITGEIYFEIEPDKQRPFLVRSAVLTTEVLGTHFNVNSYSDENTVKVTLVEGRIRVNAANQESSVIILPGEQAFAGKKGNIMVHKDINVQEVIAWKNERFRFTNENIVHIMREVARWYDVEIAYKGNMADLNFGGNISRQQNVSELLKRLEATQAVKFEVEGRRITVLKTTEGP